MATSLLEPLLDEHPFQVESLDRFPWLGFYGLRSESSRKWQLVIRLQVSAIDPYGHTHIRMKESELPRQPDS